MFERQYRRQARVSIDDPLWLSDCGFDCSFRKAHFPGVDAIKVRRPHCCYSDASTRATKRSAAQGVRWSLAECFVSSQAWAFSRGAGNPCPNRRPKTAVSNWRCLLTLISMWSVSVVEDSNNQFLAQPLLFLIPWIFLRHSVQPIPPALFAAAGWEISIWCSAQRSSRSPLS